MKKLLLIRHAEAEEPYSEIADHDRELKQNGILKCIKLGQWMNEHQMIPDKIITSSATRATQTAQYLAERIPLDHEKIETAPSIYNANVGSLLNIINNFSDVDRCMAIVGHNPTLSYLAEYISGERISLEMGNIAILTVDVPWAALSSELGKLESII